MLSKEQIKQIKGLHQKKNRKDKQQFIIEGPKMIEEALSTVPDAVLQIYVTEQYVETTAFPKDKTTIVSSKIIHQLSGLKQPQDVLAVCTFLDLKISPSSLKIGLDNIQDPGNFGTILRLAAWFGVTEIIASNDCVDCYNPKVVQASMGGIFNVKVSYLNLIEFCSSYQHPIYGAMLSGENIYRSSLSPTGILLMGNEGKGLNTSLQKYITKSLYIPKIGKGESLNVATATGILLSEFTRKNM